MKHRRKQFLSFLLTLVLVLGLMPGMSLTALAAGSGTADNPITFTTWSDWNEALLGGAPGESSTNPTYYKLTTNIVAHSIDGPITVASGRHVVLDLNGKAIDRGLTSETSNGYVIKVEGNLTIKDSGSSGRITGGYNKFDGGGVYVSKGGTFTMEGGTISNNDGGSGAVSNSDGGGVYVAEDGTFTMKGGAISGNKTRSSGGGVYVAKGGTFTMESGTISGNKTSAGTGDGGGVYVNESTFTMNDGTISGNEAGNLLPYTWPPFCFLCQVYNLFPSGFSCKTNFQSVSEKKELEVSLTERASVKRKRGLKLEIRITKVEIRK